ncbi:2-oxoacid:ferredoxin oxidoreductase subunit beta [archaeon]|nr:2-oxoacid:ferredoxin oxidoreductase subunit beta [archaeon]MBT4352282.1 2-oxoacid:ferredoxin oxidoreductase subunit beta [archaeon]MBT4648471.1 2-oxoacid:ferredoxin oxidoreductase subunit beta [archaeon]MBT6821720.1 2-oxoacid:ferredoxin oxidoreductase subunit beta [archaeon]MBT7391383.1 2-oxoacid:ferredoxin oxidoreductase subunit beta [archaeon]
MSNEVKTKFPITWCPGCSNFVLLSSIEKALKNLITKGTPIEEFTMTTGIGCHGKIYDYLGISGIYGLHGRAIPNAIGIKLANQNLKVLTFVGDGDTYSEGMSHFIHACRLNPDMTIFVHDNQIFALTTGQNTPTTEKSKKTKSTPLIRPFPINPIKLALVSGASFVARINALDMKNSPGIIEKAINHRGLSFVEIIQPCVVLHDTRTFLKNSYQLEDNELENSDIAMKKADEFDYNNDNAKMPLGIFYKKEREILSDLYPQIKKSDGKAMWEIKRKVNIEELL